MTYRIETLQRSALSLVAAVMLTAVLVAASAPGLPIVA
jgi:hypothetical protein